MQNLISFLMVLIIFENIEKRAALNRVGRTLVSADKHDDKSQF